jgi:hypothetical protein
MSMLMASDMCLEFGMQEEDNIEHKNVKYHLCTLWSTCRPLYSIGVRTLAHESRATEVTHALHGWAHKCIKQRSCKHIEDVVVVRIHLQASRGNNQGLGCSCCSPKDRGGPKSGQAYHHVPSLIHLIALLNIPMTIY